MITFDWLCHQMGWPWKLPDTILDLMQLEANHDVLDLYLWLSYRFPVSHIYVLNCFLPTFELKSCNVVASSKITLIICISFQFYSFVLFFGIGNNFGSAGSIGYSSC